MISWQTVQFGTGAITLTDLRRAHAARCPIVCFNIASDARTRRSSGGCVDVTWVGVGEGNEGGCCVLGRKAKEWNVPLFEFEMFADAEDCLRRLHSATSRQLS